MTRYRNILTGDLLLGYAQSESAHASRRRNCMHGVFGVLILAGRLSRSTPKRVTFNFRPPDSRHLHEIHPDLFQSLNLLNIKKYFLGFALWLLPRQVF